MKRLCEWQRQRKERRQFDQQTVRLLEEMLEETRRQVADMMGVHEIPADIQAAIDSGDCETASKLAARRARPRPDWAVLE